MREMASAPPGKTAVVDNQGASSTCTRFAVAKAIVDAADDFQIDLNQEVVAGVLVNSQKETPSEGKWATDFNKSSMRIQDVKTLVWYFVTIFVSKSSLDRFKAAATIPSAGGALYTRGKKYVIDWITGDPPSHDLHCVYAKGWVEQEGKAFCLNSWGDTNPQPHIAKDAMSTVYSVDIIVQDKEGGEVRAMSAFPDLRRSQFTEALDLCRRLGVRATSVLEDPLSSLQPVFQHGGFTLTGCSLLHRLVLERNLAEIVSRKSQLSPALLDSGCQRRSSIFNIGFTLTEVTALDLACRDGQREVVDIFLDRGADPNRLATYTRDGVTQWQYSPLYMAAGNNHPDICRSLLAHGARLDVGDYSPMAYAGTEEVRKILRGR